MLQRLFLCEWCLSQSIRKISLSSNHFSPGRTFIASLTYLMQLVTSRYSTIEVNVIPYFTHFRALDAIYARLVFSPFLSINLTFRLAVLISNFLSIYRSIFLSLYRSIDLSGYPYIHPSFHPSIYPSTHSSPYSSFQQSIHLFISPSFCPSILLSLYLAVFLYALHSPSFGSSIFSFYTSSA